MSKCKIVEASISGVRQNSAETYTPDNSESDTRFNTPPFLSLITSLPRGYQRPSGVEE